MRKLKYSMQDQQKLFSEFQQVAAVETCDKFRCKSFLKPCLYSTWFTFIEFVFKLVVAWSVYHLNGIFGSFFLANGTALFFHQGNEIDWTVSFDRNFQMPVGRGLGLSCHQGTKEHGGWTSCRARRFIGLLRKVLFLEKKATISFLRETSNQHPQFFLRCSSDRSTLESRIMQVKEKQKYPPQNVIRFHLQGCCCVLKRPPTLPTS